MKIFDTLGRPSVCGCWEGFRGIEYFFKFKTEQKLQASVEGNQGIIKTCTVPISALLGLIVNVKLPDYLQWELSC